MVEPFLNFEKLPLRNRWELQTCRITTHYYESKFIK